MVILASRVVAGPAVVPSVPLPPEDGLEEIAVVAPIGPSAGELDATAGAGRRPKWKKSSGWRAS